MDDLPLDLKSFYRPLQEAGIDIVFIDEERHIPDSRSGIMMAMPPEFELTMPNADFFGEDLCRRILDWEKSAFEHPTNFGVEWREAEGCLAFDERWCRALQDSGFLQEVQDIIIDHCEVARGFNRKNIARRLTQAFRVNIHAPGSTYSFWGEDSRSAFTMEGRISQAESSYAAEEIRDVFARLGLKAIKVEPCRVPGQPFYEIGLPFDFRHHAAVMKSLEGVAIDLTPVLEAARFEARRPASGSLLNRVRKALDLE